MPPSRARLVTTLLFRSRCTVRLTRIVRSSPSTARVQVTVELKNDL
eukprot:CAMPEP_0114033474 /NCGR_PEP_ID=MMETSP1159-20121227/5945_1 /TAXON_ID=88271 /ORGANISM="Picocystis salinarum" /LENGTH=45 /assembly_acc=CAM_ASM_000767